MTDELALAEIRKLSPAAKSLICHRLNNPLQIVCGNIALLDRDASDYGSVAAHRIEAADEGAQRIAREIAELFS